MNTNIKISILVTFFNQKKYVDTALTSIFMQKTSFPYVVIIGDDGSTDGTIEKIRDWQSRYPNSIELYIQERDTQKNYIKGSRASRNRLNILEKVSSPYFIFLDGDDCFTDEYKLQKQFDILENPQNRDCVACGHNICEFREDNLKERTIIPGDRLKNGKYGLKEYWSKVYIHTDTILFRSNHIADLKYEIIRDNFNDNIITYSFLQFGKIYFLKDCMANYQQNSQGLYAGEKRGVCLIREFLDYDIECIINPQMREISTKRHLGHFLEFANNHEVFENVGKEYLELAKKYSLKTMMRALEEKHLFSNSWNKDYIFLQKIKWEVRIRSLLNRFFIWW